MPDLEWVERVGKSALLIRLDPDRSSLAEDWAAQLPVYPAELLQSREGGIEPALASSLLQPMTGAYAIESSGAVLFTPRFPFVPGVEYAVVVSKDAEPMQGHGPVVLRLRRPAASSEPVTSVTEIHPVLDRIPRNLLRMYVEFSGSMSEGFADRAVTVRDVASGQILEDALLTAEPEFWDPGRRRLTVLFDPARIKQGLVPHQELGYPLVEGGLVDFVVDASFTDGAGRPLVGPGRRRYRVGPDLRGRVDPSGWTVSAPGAGSTSPLGVGFGRPLDAALLGRCLTLRGPHAEPTGGSPESLSGGTGWQFHPDRPWVAGTYTLVVEAILEDVAGNSVRRAFDRDLDLPAHQPTMGEPEEVPIVIA